MRKKRIVAFCCKGIQGVMILFQEVQFVMFHEVLWILEVEVILTICLEKVKKSKEIGIGKATHNFNNLEWKVTGEEDNLN